MRHVLLRRVRVHNEEHSKPWRNDRKEEWVLKGCVVMHPQDNQKCATSARLCFYMDAELCLSAETESLDWWSHLLFTNIRPLW